MPIMPRDPMSSNGVAHSPGLGSLAQGAPPPVANTLSPGGTPNSPATADGVQQAAQAVGAPAPQQGPAPQQAPMSQQAPPFSAGGAPGYGANGAIYRPGEGPVTSQVGPPPQAIYPSPATPQPAQIEQQGQLPPTNPMVVSADVSAMGETQHKWKVAPVQHGPQTSLEDVSRKGKKTVPGILAPGGDSASLFKAAEGPDILSPLSAQPYDAYARDAQGSDQGWGPDGYGWKPTDEQIPQHLVDDPQFQARQLRWRPENVSGATPLTGEDYTLPSDGTDPFANVSERYRNPRGFKPRGFATGDPGAAPLSLNTGTSLPASPVQPTQDMGDGNAFGNMMQNGMQRQELPPQSLPLVDMPDILKPLSAQPYSASPVQPAQDMGDGNAFLAEHAAKRQQAIQNALSAQTALAPDDQPLDKQQARGIQHSRKGQGELETLPLSHGANRHEPEPGQTVPQIPNVGGEVTRLYGFPMQGPDGWDRNVPQWQPFGEPFGQPQQAQPPAVAPRGGSKSISAPPAPPQAPPQSPPPPQPPAGPFANDSRLFGTNTPQMLEESARLYGGLLPGYGRASVLPHQKTGPGGDAERNDTFAERQQQAQAPAVAPPPQQSPQPPAQDPGRERSLVDLFEDQDNSQQPRMLGSKGMSPSAPSAALPQQQSLQNDGESILAPDQPIEPSDTPPSYGRPATWETDPYWMLEGEEPEDPDAWMSRGEEPWLGPWRSAGTGSPPQQGGGGGEAGQQPSQEAPRALVEGEGLFDDPEELPQDEASFQDDAFLDDAPQDGAFLDDAMLEEAPQALQQPQQVVAPAASPQALQQPQQSHQRTLAPAASPQALQQPQQPPPGRFQHLIDARREYLRRVGRGDDHYVRDMERKQRNTAADYARQKVSPLSIQDWDRSGGTREYHEQLAQGQRPTASAAPTRPDNYDAVQRETANYDPSQHAPPPAAAPSPAAQPSVYRSARGLGDLLDSYRQQGISQGRIDPNASRDSARATTDQANQYARYMRGDPDVTSAVGPGGIRLNDPQAPNVQPPARTVPLGGWSPPPQGGGGAASAPKPQTPLGGGVSSAPKPQMSLGDVSGGGLTSKPPLFTGGKLSQVTDVHSANVGGKQANLDPRVEQVMREQTSFEGQMNPADKWGKYGDDLDLIEMLMELEAERGVPANPSWSPSHVRDHFYQPFSHGRVLPRKPGVGTLQEVNDALIGQGGNVATSDATEQMLKESGLPPLAHGFATRCLEEEWTIDDIKRACKAAERTLGPLDGQVALSGVAPTVESIREKQASGLLDVAKGLWRPVSKHVLQPAWKAIKPLIKSDKQLQYGSMANYARPQLKPTAGLGRQGLKNMGHNIGVVGKRVYDSGPGQVAGGALTGNFVGGGLDMAARAAGYDNTDFQSAGTAMGGLAWSPAGRRVISKWPLGQKAVGAARAATNPMSFAGIRNTPGVPGKAVATGVTGLALAGGGDLDLGWDAGSTLNTVKNVAGNQVRRTAQSLTDQAGDMANFAGQGVKERVQNFVTEATRPAVDEALKKFDDRVDGVGGKVMEQVSDKVSDKVKEVREEVMKEVQPALEMLDSLNKTLGTTRTAGFNLLQQMAKPLQAGAAAWTEAGGFDNPGEALMAAFSAGWGALPDQAQKWLMAGGAALVLGGGLAAMGHPYMGLAVGAAGLGAAGYGYAAQPGSAPTQIANIESEDMQEHLINLLKDDPDYQGSNAADQSRMVWDLIEQLTAEGKKTILEEATGEGFKPIPAP